MRDLTQSVLRILLYNLNLVLGDLDKIETLKKTIIKTQLKQTSVNYYSRANNVLVAVDHAFS